MHPSFSLRPGAAQNYPAKHRCDRESRPQPHCFYSDAEFVVGAGYSRSWGIPATDCKTPGSSESAIQHSLWLLVSLHKPQHNAQNWRFFMNRVLKTTLGLVVSLFLFSALTMAETAPGTANKTVNKKEDTAHHSRLAKAAFWRHHDDAGTKAKPAAAASTNAKSQKPQAKPAQLKPVSAKVASGKNDQKPQKNSNSNSNEISKSPAKKAPVASKSPAANKTKSQPKTQTHQTASLQ
jgi:hypothetical protein